jgi:membrane dipeptidase
MFLKKTKCPLFINFSGILMILPTLIFGQWSPENASLREKAVELSQRFIITDGHVDLPYRLKIKNFRFEKEFTGIPIASGEGDFDYVRAKKGGLDAPFMSIYIPASYQENGGAVALADSLINMIRFIASEKKEYFEIATTPDDVVRIKKQGKIALPMGMENGAPVGEDLKMVSYFKQKGISYITLTHSKDNTICDSSYDTTRTWKGLSPYGYEVIDEMVKNRIMIDISHVSDDAFYQVIRHVKVPVIASHSSCRYYTPGFERNMSDDMIASLKENGGVIMINFGTTFLDSSVDEYNRNKKSELDSIIQAKNLLPGSPEALDFEASFKKSFPRLFADVHRVADHIDRVVSIAGIDHVGLGSDYDGVGDSLPVGLKDVSDYPNLIYVLLERGYSEKDIEKICSGNLFRVWNQVLSY